jgi:3-methyladenine DNA glycosylase AlkC
MTRIDEMNLKNIRYSRKDLETNLNGIEDRKDSKTLEHVNTW